MKKQHNPDNLTPEQVGEGYRLLDEDEIILGSPALYAIELINVEGHWIAGCNGNNSSVTYRTKLTREELAAARGIKPAARAIQFAPVTLPRAIEALESCVQELVATEVIDNILAQQRGYPLPNRREALVNAENLLIDYYAQR